MERMLAILTIRQAFCTAACLEPQAHALVGTINLQVKNYR
jgi:hypothetical protein